MIQLLFDGIEDDRRDACQTKIDEGCDKVGLGKTIRRSGNWIGLKHQFGDRDDHQDGRVFDIDNKLIVDGERIDFKQFETKFYKRIIPTQNPNAELEFDFSAYKSLDIGYDRKSAEIEFSKENAFFKYCDDCETTRVIDDCFSKELLNDDYGDFQEVRFPMWEIFEIMKISKKFKIQQFGKIDAMHKIIADDYEFLIMPKRWLLLVWLKRR